MRYEEIVVNALARTLEFDAEFPSTRLPMYRRVGTRQQQLYTFASKRNPDFYGVSASANLNADDELDLKDMAGVPAVNQSVGVQRVEICDHGTSTYTDGDRVNIVSIDDIEADLAPRATLRDYVIKGVGTDLNNVTSLCVYYPKYPDMPDTDEDGTTEISIAEAHAELLIIDLTKHLLRKCMSMEATVKAAHMASLTEEEGEALAAYLADIDAFGIGQSHRFSEPAGATTR